ncbi:MAG: hypothetical protein NXI01_08825 [Gammaproteobacteria bacterium]|nr:hypothetical protein [Gammaproteobacteria bacterium]
MLDMLEENSGTIAVVLSGVTVVGVVVLMTTVPAFAAAYVTVTGVQIFTTATGVGAAASGASYIRRENQRNADREHVYNDVEEEAAVEMQSSSTDRVNAQYTAGQEQHAQSRNMFAADEEESSAALRIVQAELKAAKAERQADRLRIERLEGLVNTISVGLDVREMDEMRHNYGTGNGEATDSSDEDDTRPLLSESNQMWQQAGDASSSVPPANVQGGLRRRNVG